MSDYTETRVCDLQVGDEVALIWHDGPGRYERIKEIARAPLVGYIRVLVNDFRADSAMNYYLWPDSTVAKR